MYFCTSIVKYELYQPEREIHSAVSWLHELGCSPIVLSWVFGACSATTLIIAPDGFVESDELSNKYINFIYRLLSAYLSL